MTLVPTQTTQDINAPSLPLLIEIYRVIETKSSRLLVQSPHSIHRLLLLFSLRLPSECLVTTPDTKQPSTAVTLKFVNSWDHSTKG